MWLENGKPCRANRRPGRCVVSEYKALHRSSYAPRDAQSGIDVDVRVRLRRSTPYARRFDHAPRHSLLSGSVDIQGLVTCSLSLPLSPLSLASLPPPPPLASASSHTPPSSGRFREEAWCPPRVEAEASESEEEEVKPSFEAHCVHPKP